MNFRLILLRFELFLLRLLSLLCLLLLGSSSCGLYLSLFFCFHGRPVFSLLLFSLLLLLLALFV